MGSEEDCSLEKVVLLRKQFKIPLPQCLDT